MCERYDYILQCGYGQVTQSRIGCVTRSDDNVPILCIQWSIPRLFFTLCKQLLHNKMLLSLAGFEFRLSKLKVSMLTTRRNTTARMLRIAITQGRSGGQVVIVITFCSNHTSSNPAQSTNCLKRTKITKKRPGMLAR